MSTDFSLTKGMRWLDSDFEYRDDSGRKSWNRGVAEILNSYTEEIPYGTPRDSIDDLGGGYRQLLQESDYHAVGKNLLLKKRSEEEITREDGEKWETTGDLSKSILLLADFFGLDSSNYRAQIEDYRRGAKVTLESGMVIEPQFLTKNPAIFLEIRDSLNWEPSINGRDSYRWTEFSRVNPNSEAAEERLYDFGLTLRMIESFQTILEIEKTLKDFRKLYDQDICLITSWSEQRREEDRTLYSAILRRRGFDEEKIRRSLWGAFDSRRDEEVEETYLIQREMKVSWWEAAAPRREEKLENPITVPLKVRRARSSIWDKEKMVAFRDLNFTRKQWEKLYLKLWNQFGNILVGLALTAKNQSDLQKVREALGKYQWKIGKNFVDKIIKAIVENQCTSLI